MLDLLVSIQRRTKYLDSALPKSRPNRAESTIAYTLPQEPWAEQFHGLNVPAAAMSNLFKKYAAKATDSIQLAIVALLRSAANGETPRLDAEIELQLLCLPDCGKAFTEEFLADWNRSVNEGASKK
jgi:hypothetical protein